LHGAGNGFTPFQTGAGLFSWLVPADSWDQGTCTGYTQSALNVIADPIFETARFFVVIAIIVGLGVVLWVLCLACISLGPKQVYLLAACQLLLVVLVPMSFLAFNSHLCSKVGQDTKCTVDEGGMVAIVAAISWFLGFLITIYFMQSPEKLIQEREEEIQRRAEALVEKKRTRKILKQQRREEKARELAMIERERMQQEQAMACKSTRGKARVATGASTPVTVASGGEDCDNVQQEKGEALPTTREETRETRESSIPVTVIAGGDDYDNVELAMTRSLDRIEHIMMGDEDYYDI